MGSGAPDFSTSFWWTSSFRFRGFGFRVRFRDIHTILGGPLPYIRVYRALGLGFRLAIVLNFCWGELFLPV